MAPMGWREWMALLALSVLWAGSFFFIAVALPDIPPMTVVAGRVGIAALALLAVVALTGRAITLDRRVLGALAVMGVLNGLIPYALIAWGQTRLDSGTAAILNATTPLFSVGLAHLLGRERMTKARVGGVLIGLLGVGVLMGPQALGGLGGNMLAALAILGSAFSYALAAVWGLRLKAVPPLIAACGQITMTALLAIPASLAVDQPWLLRPSATAIGAVIGIALLSTALAYLLYFRVLATAGATNVLLVTFLVPPSAMTLGVLFLGERPGLAALVAMALIFVGIALVDGRILRRRNTA